MKVLVVDDHAELRHMTVQFLDLLGHSALQAGSAGEARQALASPDAGIDAILLDLHLGAASGLALADQLERERPDLRVLLMSGYGSEDAQADRPDHARRLFLEKPFTLDGLEAALATLMSARG